MMSYEPFIGLGDRSAAAPPPADSRLLVGGRPEEGTAAAAQQPPGVYRYPTADMVADMAGRDGGGGGEDGEQIVEPRFAGPIENVTVNVGREAVLHCHVDNLKGYKVGLFVIMLQCKKRQRGLKARFQ